MNLDDLNEIKEADEKEEDNVIDLATQVMQAQYKLDKLLRVTDEQLIQALPDSVIDPNKKTKSLSKKMKAVEEILSRAVKERRRYTIANELLKNPLLIIPTSAINKRLEEGSEISEDSSLNDSL